MLELAFSTWGRRSQYIALLNGFVVVGTFAIAENCARAQSTIIPDNSLGTEASVVTPNVVIKGVLSEEISGGLIKGTNLLHSFEEFNVSPGRGAYFTPPSGVENILTRVTGANPSQILGTLGVTAGSANLFLMNPNGLIFGQTARLDVMGSFVGTTANAIRLSNGDIFSARPNQSLPTQLLKVNPNAFLFNQIANQLVPAIQVNQASLSVRDGMSLLLLGGNVTLDGANVQVLGGQIDIGGLSAEGTIELSGSANSFNLRFPENIQRSDVSLVNKSRVNVTDRGQGSVVINARNLNIVDESSISVGIRSTLRAHDSISQNVTLNASGIVKINQNSQVRNVVETDATGNAGNININAGKVEVTGGQIRTRTLGNGNAGNINIKAGEILIDNPAYVSEASRRTSDDKPAIDASNFSNDSVKGRGRSGNVSLAADGSIVLIGRGEGSTYDNKVISTYSASRGRGEGHVLLKANGSISLDNAFIVTSTFTTDTNAGEILLQGQEAVSLKNNSSLVATSFARGNSGNITLTSSGLVLVENSLMSANIGAAQGSFPAQGNAGNIYISGNSVFVTAGSEVTTRNALGGNSGNIQVDATDIVEISGRVPELFSKKNRSNTAVYSTLLTTAEERATGQAGDININVPSGTLLIADGASLRAESQGIFRGGNINVHAKTVELNGGGKLLTSASNSGDAGNITLSASARITIAGSNPNFDEVFQQAIIRYGSRREAEIRLGTVGGASGIYASTSETSTGKSGDINVTTGRLVVRDDAQLSVSSGQKDAGNLEIQARSIFLDYRGKLRAATASGKGGDINLQVRDNILMRHQSQISADAGNNGNGGNININSPNGFIVAVPWEDSNILANAEQGKGGNITIVSSGIYGFENSFFLTSLSDINASSDFGSDGTVQIEILGIDPDLRPVNFPTEIVRATLSQGCQKNASQEENRFFITGRGGLPSNPYEPLTSESFMADWITPKPNSQVPLGLTTVEQNSHNLTSKSIVEATGWKIDPEGEVVLTASTSTIPPLSSQLGASVCGSRLIP
ncbi:hypothetical protein NUACC21_13480 [Scytonema sp. NUACC21]